MEATTLNDNRIDVKEDGVKHHLEHFHEMKTLTRRENFLFYPCFHCILL